MVKEVLGEEWVRKEVLGVGRRGMGKVLVCEIVGSERKLL